MMSGFDWGSFVYRNGEYLEYTSILGVGRIQLTWTKNVPYLLILDKPMDQQEFVQRYAKTYVEVDEDGYHWVDMDLTRYEGELDGYRFRAQHFASTMLDLELIVPDGTVWTARCGYDYGDTHENSDRTRHYGRVPWA